MKKVEKEVVVLSNGDKIYKYVIEYFDDNGKLINTKRTQTKYTPCENPQKRGRKTTIKKDRKYKSDIKRRIGDYDITKLNKVVKLLNLMEEN